MLKKHKILEEYDTFLVLCPKADIDDPIPTLAKKPKFCPICGEKIEESKDDPDEGLKSHAFNTLIKPIIGQGGGV